MCKILLACDLDNTLLHSYRHRKEADICVEKIEGKEQGYMFPQTYSLLPTLFEAVHFVPVTSRSVSQYIRIQWPHQSEPRFAVTTNGAVLCGSNEHEEAWILQSKKLAAQYKTEFEKMVATLGKMQCVIRQRMIDGLYLFALCNDESDANAVSCTIGNLTSLDVVQTGRKIYLLIPSLNKGTAVERLKEIFQPQVLICAGDSNTDIPMLNKADIAIVPNSEFANCITASEIMICPVGDNFSDYVIASALDAAK